MSTDDLQQLPLFEEIICDVCDVATQTPIGTLPEGWELLARGHLCVRASGRRFGELIEIHACPKHAMNRRESLATIAFGRNRPLEERKT